MVPLIWGAVAAIVGLLLLLAESVMGLHGDGVSHANVVMWLVITPVVAIGSMLHRRMKEEAFNYMAAMPTGLLTSFTATAGLFLVWVLFINVMFPSYFDLMHVFAETQARAQGHTGMRLAQEIQVSHLIFAYPTFYLISAIIPLLAGTIASVIGAIGIRKLH